MKFFKYITLGQSKTVNGRKLTFWIKAWGDDPLGWFSVRIEGLHEENGVTLSVTLKRKKGLICDTSWVQRSFKFNDLSC